MGVKKVIVSVINDLVSDQRVHKSCLLLTDMGFDVTLIGRKLPGSPPMDERPYHARRMKLLFTKGPMFYAFFNLRLFWYLLWHRADLLVANDLDTLLANYLASKLKSTALVYDSHEYFTEVPELQGRKAKKIWERIEAWIFPDLNDVITVNDSIARLYEQKYGKKLVVVRNVPRRAKEIKPLAKSDLNIPQDFKVVILQGAGINVQRGAEEAVLAMKHIEKAVLLIVGGGDVLPELKRIVARESLEDKVRFIPRQSIERLYAYTAMADVGLSLDKDTNLNYRYSLPNKIFDYIQCLTPVLVSDLPEVRKIVETYKVGRVLPEHSPEMIAKTLGEMFDADFKNTHRAQLEKAATELVWENEREVLRKLYRKYL